VSQFHNGETNLAMARKEVGDGDLGAGRRDFGFFGVWIRFSHLSTGGPLFEIRKFQEFV
jgi:hypothetical protein